MDSVYMAVAALVGVLIGAGAAWFLLNSVLNKKKESILAEADKEGETIKEKKILQAKEKFLEMKMEKKMMVVREGKMRAVRMKTVKVKKALVVLEVVAVVVQ